jgi:hypothetical protein
MESVIINNIAVSELPLAWQERLHALPDARVTVRIETAIPNQAAVAIDHDPAFGIWRDRTELDVANYVQQLRGVRYQIDGMSKE